MLHWLHCVCVRRRNVGREGIKPWLGCVGIARGICLLAVGMAVAADIADPASPNHPIHPIWKAELGRRLFLILDNLLYANASSPVTGLITPTREAQGIPGE